MLFNLQQLYTPPLRREELTDRALLIDTETLGSGPTIEMIEIALADVSGEILYETLIQPRDNPLPPPSKHRRFDRAEFTIAPEWPEVWPQISSLIDAKLLIAYNASFDRRALAAMCAHYRHSSPERGWRCAMQLVKEVLGTKKSLTLTEACGYYGLMGGNHRAGRDVQATGQLLQVMRSAQR